jgi:hypothetical protein
MKTKLHAVAAFLAAAVFVHAQDASTLAADTQLLIAEKTYLEAKVAKLKAEESLQTQLDAASTAQKALDKADQDAKDQAQLDTLKAIGDLAAKMPTGSYTASADSVATPKAMELAFLNLEEATGKLHGEIFKECAGKTVVFVDAIPGPKASFELLFYNSLITQIDNDAEELDVLSTQIESLPAAAIISALPSIVSAVSGFFRVDHTEKVFDAKFTGATAITSLIGRLATDKSHPVYFGLENYAFANLPPLEKTPLGLKVIALSELDTKLAAKAEGIDTTALDKAVTDATNDVATTKAEIALLKGRTELLTELAKASPQNAPAYLATITEIGNRLLVLGTKLIEQNTKLADAKATVAPFKAEKEKIGALRERIAKLFTDLRSTEGSPPLFVRLIRDQQLKDMTSQPGKVSFVQLSVAASPQGTITRKSFWGQSSLASSLVALEYRVADGSFQITAAGIIPSHSLKKLDLSAAQSDAKK